MAKNRTVKTVRSLDGRIIKEVKSGESDDAVEKHGLSTTEFGSSAGTSDGSARTTSAPEWSTTYKRDPFLHDLMT